jgi:hypothetical protein
MHWIKSIDKDNTLAAWLRHGVAQYSFFFKDMFVYTFLDKIVILYIYISDTYSFLSVTYFPANLQICPLFRQTSPLHLYHEKAIPAGLAILNPPSFF